VRGKYNVVNKGGVWHDTLQIPPMQLLHEQAFDLIVVQGCSLTGKAGAYLSIVRARDKTRSCFIPVHTIHTVYRCTWTT